MDFDIKNVLFFNGILTLLIKAENCFLNAEIQTKE